MKQHAYDSCDGFMHYTGVFDEDTHRWQEVDYSCHYREDNQRERAEMWEAEARAVKNALADQLDRQEPIDRGLLTDLIYRLDMLDT